MEESESNTLLIAHERMYRTIKNYEDIYGLTMDNFLKLFLIGNEDEIEKRFEIFKKLIMSGIEIYVNYDTDILIEYIIEGYEEDKIQQIVTNYENKRNEYMNDDNKENKGILKPMQRFKIRPFTNEEDKLIYEIKKYVNKKDKSAIYIARSKKVKKSKRSKRSKRIKSKRIKSKKIKNNKK